MKDQVMFKEYLATLCEIHGREISKMLTDIYWKVLEPFTNEECEECFKQILLTSKYFPKPADFVDLLYGRKEDRATEAWLEVLQAVKSIGNYQSVKFSDPVIHSVIQAMGGWVRLASEMTEDDEKWKQKEFEKLYQVVSRNSRGKHPDYLPGSCEIDNAANGYDVSSHPITRIGYTQPVLIAQGGK